MKRVLVFLQACFFIFIVVGSATAANVAIISTERELYVRADAGPMNSSDSVSTLSLGSWNEDIDVSESWMSGEPGSDISAFTQADQDSSITLGNALVIGASGGTYAEWWEGEASARSNLYVTFEVANQTPYDLLITTLEEDHAASSFVGLGTALGVNDIFYYNDYDSGKTYADTLEPGTYYFEIRSDLIGGMGIDHSDISYDIQFTVSNVPIPGAVWLLGSGLIGIVGIRRKLKKA